MRDNHTIYLFIRTNNRTLPLYTENRSRILRYVYDFMRSAYWRLFFEPLRREGLYLFFEPQRRQGREGLYFFPIGTIDQEKQHAFRGNNGDVYDFMRSAYWRLFFEPPSR